MAKRHLTKSFVMTLITIFSNNLYAEEYFDPGLLHAVNGTASNADKEILTVGNQPAGNYRVDIIVNGKKALATSVRFELDKHQDLYPCLSFQLYKRIGLDMSKLAKGAVDSAVSGKCTAPEEQMPGITTDFDFSKMALTISAPQTMLLEDAKDTVPVEEWDEGITGFLTQYQLSGQTYTKNSTGQSNSVYANLTNGLNLKAWRLRNNSTLSQEDGFHNISNYIERALPAVKGELTIGDASTNADVFDAVLLRGVQINSDEDMRPDQLTGFAPVVRGIAKSNAQVTIRDNGYVIYQRTVPPGPFLITDLAAVSLGGKLEVTVKEADGSETHNTIAYSSLPQLLRMGQMKYGLAIGKYQPAQSDKHKDKDLLQTSLSWGLPMDTTIYGGSQYNNEFRSFALGTGINLHQVGALAFDMTRNHHPSVDKMSESAEGSMLRMTYSNDIAATDTQIQLDSRHYRKDYLSFNDWMNSTSNDSSSRNEKEYNLTINQTVNEGNSFYAAINRAENFGHDVSRMWQLGWSGSVYSFPLSLTYSRTRSEGAEHWDNQLSLSLSIPLSDTVARSWSPTLNYTANSALEGDLSNSIGVTAQGGENQELGFNSQFNYASQHGQSDISSANIGANYRGETGELDVNYNVDHDQYLSWNASGSMLAHQGGVTLGRYSDGALVLVSIPNAPDVPINNGQGAKTDSEGYALIGDIRPYHVNSVNIDTEKAAKEIDFESTTTDLVPTKDAFVLAQFRAVAGRKVVATINYHDSKPPFGARVYIENRSDAFYVSEQGQVYINDAPEDGEITVKWGEDKICHSHIKLPSTMTDNKRLTLISVDCK